MNATADHQPVMLEETLNYLNVKPNSWYLDATFGRGGHTSAILEKHGQVVALDWDIEAIQYGESHFHSAIAARRLILKHANFASITDITAKLIKKGRLAPFAGVLFDFGTSSDQLTSGERGFSFNHPGPLDMRMDQRLGVKAMDLLAAVPEKQLAELFYQYGGESESRQIAKAIKLSPQPIKTTTDLADLIIAVKRQRSHKLHPATKVFQALRIAVNSELDEISRALPQSLAVLEPGGVIISIAFHEGEDRLVKTAFRHWQKHQDGEIETKKPITPSKEEISKNPRARSAKLRVFRKQVNES